MHRDMKPSNILVEPERLRLSHRLRNRPHRRETGVTRPERPSTPWHIWPRTVQHRPADPSSDIYALACVLYECVTGQQPFPGDTFERVASGHIFSPPPRPSEISRTIPTALDAVIARGLAKQPSDRYPTAVDMASAAKEVISRSSQPNVVAPGPPQHTWAQPHTGAPPAFSYPHSVPTLHAAAMPPLRNVRKEPAVCSSALWCSSPPYYWWPVSSPSWNSHRARSPPPPPSATASGGEFSGTYTADYGPGYRPRRQAGPDAPATTSNWAVRSECGASGCVATAANVSSTGMALLSNLTFDQLGGTWVAVGLASAQCSGDQPEECRLSHLEPASRRHVVRRDHQGFRERGLLGQTLREVHPHRRSRPQQGSRSRRPTTAGGLAGGSAARQLPADDDIRPRWRRTRENCSPPTPTASVPAIGA